MINLFLKKPTPFFVGHEKAFTSAIFVTRKVTESI